MLITFKYIYKIKTTIKNQIEELKKSASRTGLIFCDNNVMFSLVQEMLLKLEQIEELIELENELYFTDVAESVKESLWPTLSACSW